MVGARHMILGHVLSGFCHKMNRCKPIPPSTTDTPLNRCLTTLDLTLLGVGHMVGAGIYVVTGTVIHDMAGPLTAISFLIAGVISLMAALCYAEFGTRIPRTGSAYTYTYVSLGEFWAFVIGWNIILEYMLGAASVARAWSGYLDSLLGGMISNTTMSITGELHQALLSRHPDLLAFTICLFASLILTVGVKASAHINNVLTVLNLLVIFVIIAIGFCYADLNNWSLKYGGLMPHGLTGLLAGAASCFYAFTGFDSISSASEEAKDPNRSIPSATILSMGFVTLCYFLVALALTLMVPHTLIDPETAISAAFSYVHVDWAKYAVGIGAVCGMTTTLLGSMFSLPRCIYAMSADGLLFGFLGNSKSQIPLSNLIISGLSTAVIALLFDLEKLVEIMSIGTLMAYTIVSAAVIILRYRPSPTIEYCSKASSPISDKADSSVTGSPSTETGSLASTAELYETLNVGRLLPMFSWLAPLLGGWAPGSAVTFATVMYTLSAATLTAYSHVTHEAISREGMRLGYLLAPTVMLTVICCICVLIIMAHRQNPAKLAFRVPLVPLVPLISINMNVLMMVHLNAFTWVRFGVWMTFGLLVYFIYGIHHSEIGEGSTDGLLSRNKRTNDNTRWGAIDKTGTFTRRLRAFAGGKAKSDDRKPIIDEEELYHRE